MAALSRIAPELPVSNLQNSIKYYEESLGFELAMQMPGGDYAIVERDDVAIHLFQDDASLVPVGVHIFTPDLEALHEELSQHDAHITQHIELKPWGNREFRVKDDSGNILKFTESTSNA
jgi:uncharacterized glyoxalase superfamily protein PhnB